VPPTSSAARSRLPRRPPRPYLPRWHQLKIAPQDTRDLAHAGAAAPHKSHGRRKFFELADVTAKARGKPVVIAPLALEAVIRIDAIFDVEREINGRSIDDRLAVRRARVAPLVADLEAGPSTQALRFSLVRRPSLCLLRKPARLSVKHHLVN
jgi:hypothetical protein